MMKGLQRLRKGIALCAANFPRFVDTFNLLVDFAENITGDGNTRNDGRVIVDKSIPGRPFIYCRGCGGQTTPTANATPRPFDIVDGFVVASSIPCPVETVSTSAYEIDTDGGDILLHVTYSAGAGVYTATVDQTSQAQTSTHAQFTLYEFSNGAVTKDTRPTVVPVFAL